MLNN
jgi:hypothetical protein